MQIFEKLFNGDLQPYSRTYNNHPSIAELERLREKIRGKLLESINAQEEELLEKYLDAQAEIDDIKHYAQFTYGLKIGILLMTEAFNGADELTNNGI